jgi:hypothetical protein
MLSITPLSTAAWRRGHHFSGEIAQRHVMAQLRHFNGRLPFAAAGIQHSAAPAPAAPAAVPDPARGSPGAAGLCGAVNIARKLFSNVIEIAILHGRLHKPTQNRYFVIPTPRMKRSVIRSEHNFGYMVKKGTIWHAFHAKKIVGGLLLPLPALLLLIGIGIALLWFSRFQRTGKLCVSLGWLLLTLLSLQPVADSLLKPIEDRYPTWRGEQPVSYVVVLGGGYTWNPEWAPALILSITACRA